MEKEKALTLVGSLAKASSRHVLVVNSNTRFSSSKAAENEVKCAKALLKQLTEDVIEDKEIEEALGW